MPLSLEAFRRRMSEETKKTREIKSIQVSGSDLNDALQQAALELSLPLRALEYEVLEKGHKGVLGINRTLCRIIVYESVRSKDKGKEQAGDEDTNLEDGQEAQEYENLDGRYSIRFSTDGVMLKIFPPQGEGLAVTLEEVMVGLQGRGVFDIDTTRLKTLVEQANQMWVKIGQFEYINGNNAQIEVNVSEDKMKVLAVMKKSRVGGLDLSVDDIRGQLAKNRVIHGILEDVVQELEDFPTYDIPVCVAQGTNPQHGRNANIIYNFDVAPNKIHIHEEADGSIDFKKQNRIQNVVSGQILARKIPGEEGISGQNVYGGIVPAREGKDIEIPIGKNVKLVEDGSAAEAEVGGHVILKSGKITVETVLIIPDNVDISTGNINVFGSVEVRGNVEDGFEVSAQGNIAVYGYVSRANLDAGGDIFVSRGINGGEGEEFGKIKAGKSIWSSYIQNSNAEAGEYVIVSSGIVNSNIVSQKKVLCKGGKARIVGGYIRASEEVNAVIFGSTAGVKTIIEVGYDPKIKEEIHGFKEELEKLAVSRSKISLNIQSIIRQVRIKKIKFSEEKKKHFGSLQVQFNAINKRINQIESAIETRQEYLDSLITNGRMSAASRVMAGVVLRIRDVEYVVRESYDYAVTFSLDGTYIRTGMYQEIKEDITRS